MIKKDSEKLQRYKMKLKSYRKNVVKNLKKTQDAFKK